MKKQVTEREKISMTNTIDNDIFRIHNNISYESIRKIENPVKKNLGKRLKELQMMGYLSDQ